MQYISAIRIALIVMTKVSIYSMGMFVCPLNINSGLQCTRRVRQKQLSL